MFSKLALALTGAVLAAGALTVGYHAKTGRPLWVEVVQLLTPVLSPWGFEVSFESLADDSGYGAWRAGPRDAFDRRDPSELAPSSLAWLERTIGSQEWRNREWLRLERVYPSGRRVVRAVHANGTDLSWDEQLAAWFDRASSAFAAVEAMRRGRHPTSWSQVGSTNARIGREHG